MTSSQGQQEEKEVLEPEVLPPLEKERKGSTWKSAKRAFGPVLGGLFIDFTDLATMGPAGFLLGGLVGYWVAGVHGLPFRTKFIIAILAGYYCMLPGTQFMPLATLIGSYVRFRESR